MSRNDRLKVSQVYQPDTRLAGWYRPNVWSIGTPTGAVTADTAVPEQQNPLAAIGDTAIGDWPRVSGGDVERPDPGTMPEDPNLPTGKLR